MKRLLIWTVSILFLLTFLHSCVYHHITHLNEEELEWLTNRHEGEMMSFTSLEGTKDTVIICKIEVSNSLIPFNWTYLNTSNTEYVAGGCIDYRFNRTTGCEGSFYVLKLDNNKPICFSGGLLGRWSRRVSLKLTKLKINNITLNDVVLFDENDTEQIANHNQAAALKSYAWSKKYGLVQYTFQDGTTFTRTDIGN